MARPTTSVSIGGGVTLSYIEAGSGEPLVLIPGWSQTAAQWEKQIAAFSAAGYRVIALDQRGHGDSSKPAGGYRVTRLATDLEAFLAALDLTNVTVIGHSMGVSTIWAYFDQFGSGRIGRMVQVDQAPMVTGLPGWGDADRSQAGCLFPDVNALAGFYGAVLGAGDAASLAGILRGMFRPETTDEDMTWIAENNLKFPRQEAADLLFNHCLLDWRDVVKTVSVPTLVVGSEASIFSAESQRWSAAQIPGAAVEIFEAEDGGSHFMFWNNPERFNRVVLDWLAATPAAG